MKKAILILTLVLSSIFMVSCANPTQERAERPTHNIEYEVPKANKRWRAEVSNGRYTVYIWTDIKDGKIYNTECSDEDVIRLDPSDPTRLKIVDFYTVQEGFYLKYVDVYIDIWLEGNLPYYSRSDNSKKFPLRLIELY